MSVIEIEPGTTAMTAGLMRLQYGVNEAHGWRHFALGPGRERIKGRLREIGTRVIGISVSDAGTPNPMKEWRQFAACVDAILATGATPMITFAKLRPPFEDSRAVSWFAQRCGDTVWSCIEQWGGETVRDWYWSVLSNPNSDWVHPGLTFETYRRIYLEVVPAMLRWLAPHLRGQRPLIGGSGIDGFQPFWTDWVWRFVHEVDNELIGFVSWYQCGDWRPLGEWGAPSDEDTYRHLLLARTSEYADRAAAIGRVLRGRQIRNVCGRLNAHSHHEVPVSRRFNQTFVGAAYYASALLELMRGGGDVEMFWMGTDAGPYGLWDHDGNPTPVFHAKRLCAQYVRYGDWLSFPSRRPRQPFDVVIVRGTNQRQSALIVHRRDAAIRYPLSALVDDASQYSALLKIDPATGNGIATTTCDGELAFDGYGVAVVTTEIAEGGPEE